MGRWVTGVGLATIALVGALVGAWMLLLSGRSAVPARPILSATGDLPQADTPSTRLVRAAMRRADDAPGSSEAWYQVGLAFVANSVAEPAHEALRHAVELDAGHARAWYLLAVLAEQKEDVDQAVLLARKALVLEPNYAPGWCRLGAWLLDQDEIDSARAAFEQAIRADPHFLPARLGPARVALREGQPEKALSILDPILQEAAARGRAVDPQLRQMHLLATVRAGGSIDGLQAARPAPPEQPDPWLAEAEKYRADRRSRSAQASQLLAAGRFDGAIAILESLRREDPENPAILGNLVAAHRAKGDLRRSAELGEEAIARFPEAHQPYLNLALTRLAIGGRSDGSIAPHEVDHAARLLEAAIARNPAAAEARAARGRLHGLLGEHEQAIEQFRLAGIAEPANATWSIEQGRAELAAGRLEAAIATLQRAVGRTGEGQPDAAPLLREALAQRERAKPQSDPRTTRTARLALDDEQGEGGQR